MTNGPSESMTTFADLQLRPELLTVLSTLGYEEPTPIQRQAIPLLLEGRDLLGQAATGTGKTAAFALPILNALPDASARGRDPMALVLVPTRELAMQVSEAIHRYGHYLGARVLPIYGGQPIVRQLQALERGVDVVIATPGRAVDHISRGTLRLGGLSVVVLDEADEMLDMGFAEELEEILRATPRDRQTVLFSATLPRRIDAIARKHQRDPARIDLSREASSTGNAPLVRQNAYIVARAHKANALGRILDIESPAAAIVFCRTREEVDSLTESLKGRGYRAEALHGGMDQPQRDRVMARLRNETADLLVATDVAARGLDIDHLTHVINYDVPSAPDAYTHRIGRVGRAGREGVAITLAEPREHHMLKSIERVTRQRITVKTLPTLADLRARRLDVTSAALRESLLVDDLDAFRVVVEKLADEFDIIEVALAAVKLAHDATTTAGDSEEIPEARADGGRKPKDARARSGQGGGFDKKRAWRPSPNTARVWISTGRKAGIRPADLVGAIANESDLSGKQIGGIEISENFSLVEVPIDSVDEVIAALKGAKIKGKSATIRRERLDSTR
jgi:ATP-dependent RNA helicase DeaD